jgi:CHAT domain-containing protein/tetratricopeptide (TPR) repeat protein
MTPRNADSLAEAAAQLVGTNPRTAHRVSLEAVALARSAGDPVAEARAWRANGRAAFELGRPDEALGTLRSAVQLAQRAGAHVVAAEARMSLAYVLAEKGRTAAALSEIDKATPHLRGLTSAKLLMQRGLVLWRAGRTDEALATYQRALPTLRRGDDRLSEARLYSNRGLLYVDRGEYASAEADLRRAGALYQQHGQELLVVENQFNLGWVALRRGDVPAALELLDAAEAAYQKHEVARPEIPLTRAELLLSVGLVGEARETAERAIESSTAAGLRSLLAEALLMFAQASLAEGNTDAAQEAAERAARLFTRQRRPGWAAVARYVALRADERAGLLTQALRRRALRVADQLAAIGWRAQELDARLIAARVALVRGDVATVRRELQRAAGARTAGPTELRIRAWYAEALMRLATGDRAGAERALRAGFRVMERQRATLGATELRVHIASHAGDLATLGLDLAAGGGSPEKMLDWIERWRAGSLRLRPIRPPDDAPLARALAELRHTTSEAEAALLDGKPGGRLLARKEALEDRVRRLSRRAAGSLFQPDRPPPLDELAARLGDRVLLELVDHRGHVLAVTVRDGVARMHQLGRTSAARRTLEAILFALRRLARGHGSAASLQSARESVGTAAARMAATLLDPLADVLDDRPLVVVPTGSLRSTPWSLLPGGRSRSVTVAPSAAIWLRAARRPRERSGDGRVVLVSGPGLGGAAAEIDQLAAAYPEALRLDGAGATVEATLSALDGADVAHIAAHGRLRGDNPLFSALELSDGPLTVYDLERLSEAPRLVLLPACQSGVGSELAGDEVMGLTAALFALGARTAVATVVPVPDEATRPLMVALHDGLRAGLSVADALVRAQAASDPDDPAALATAGGFVCFGAG